MSRIDGKLRHEMALTDHWRRQVEFRHCRLSLLVAELTHSDFLTEPVEGGADGETSLPQVADTAQVSGPDPGTPKSGRPLAPVTGKRPLRQAPRAQSKTSKRAKVD